MSDALHPTTLRFDGRQGLARFANSGGPLDQKPVVPGLGEWDQIDYAPGAVSLIKPPGGQWRDLERDEVSAVLRWLRYRTLG